MSKSDDTETNLFQQREIVQQVCAAVLEGI